MSKNVFVVLGGGPLDATGYWYGVEGVFDSREAAIEWIKAEGFWVRENHGFLEPAFPLSQQLLDAGYKCEIFKIYPECFIDDGEEVWCYQKEPDIYDYPTYRIQEFTVQSSASVVDCDG